MIYFDNAATSGKKPTNVIREVNNALVNYNANPGRSGHSLSEKTAEKIYTVRKKVSEFFGASGEESVIFTMNCTHAANGVIKGVLKKGDHIIISSLEHNSVIRPIVKTGVDYDIAQVDLYDDNVTVENFKGLIRPNTRMIFCTAASNVTGKILPILQLGALCRERGLLFGVDAAQLAGLAAIDMKKMGIDFLCIAPHKGLYAPTGIGVLIAEKYIENTILEGGTGSNSSEFVQPDDAPERHESGTVNIPGILGLGAGIDFVKSKGIDKMYQKEAELIKFIYKGLKGLPNVILYTPFPSQGLYVPVLSFNIKGIHSERVTKKLAEKGIAVRGGLHCSPLAHRQLGTEKIGAVRVSVSYFNTIREAEYFLRVISSENFQKI